MSKLVKTMILLILASMAALPLAACAAKSSEPAIQTAVAKTLAAVPPQAAQKVTQLVEVTRLVEVYGTATIDPLAALLATNTPTGVSSPSATPALTVTPKNAPGGSALNTATPAAPLPGSGPLGWSLQFFTKKVSNMTDLQKKDLIANLPGKTVSWYAILDNITSDGDVMMKYPFGMVGNIILKDVPLETALKITRYYQVEFTGTIESYDGLLSNNTILTYVKILAFYIEPTPTITATPTPRGFKLP